MFTGLLPAAGLATRMQPFMYPKELLPIRYEQVVMSNHVRPKLLIEHSLESLKVAGVDQLFIVVPQWKPEIMRYLEDGRQFGHNISYLYNSKALGLADALMSGYPWLKSKNTCFAMPDTVFQPVTAFQDVLKEFECKNADLVLGVFPTDEAQHFAPVQFDIHRKVLRIWEKPADPLYNNAWGIAVWNAKFWEYFNLASKKMAKGSSVTEVFNNAAQDGLRVFAVFFENGSYKDIGRINDIVF